MTAATTPKPVTAAIVVIAILMGCSDNGKEAADNKKTEMTALSEGAIVPPRSPKGHHAWYYNKGVASTTIADAHRSQSYSVCLWGGDTVNFYVWTGCAETSKVEVSLLGSGSPLSSHPGSCALMTGTRISVDFENNPNADGAIGYYKPVLPEGTVKPEMTSVDWHYQGSDLPLITGGTKLRKIRFCVRRERNTMNLQVEGDACGRKEVAVTGWGCADLQAVNLSILKDANPNSVGARGTISYEK